MDMSNVLPDLSMVEIGLKGLCPKCQKEPIFEPGITLNLRDTCEGCGLDLSKNDSADGPAVFIIFILGAALVPLALLLEYAIHPPLWVQTVLWSVITLILTLGMLRPLKGYIIALQYKHRPNDWT